VCTGILGAKLIIIPQGSLSLECTYLRLDFEVHSVQRCVTDLVIQMWFPCQRSVFRRNSYVQTSGPKNKSGMVVQNGLLALKKRL
jgi:hypothetical protein